MRIYVSTAQPMRKGKKAELCELYKYGRGKEMGHSLGNLRSFLRDIWNIKFFFFCTFFI
jgi:hypothetical protein